MRAPPFLSHASQLNRPYLILRPSSDAVLLNLTHTLDSQSHDIQHKTVLASAKSPTTPDVTTGIRNAIQSVLHQVPGDAKKDIEALSIGTTVRFFFLCLLSAR